MTYKTIGIGGDYANFSSAVSSLISAVAFIVDDYTFTFLGDITENVGTISYGANHIFLNNHTIVFDLNGYTWTNNIGVIGFTFPGIFFDLTPANNWQGTLEIKNGNIVTASTANPDVVSLEIDFKGDITTNSQRVIVHDITFINYSAYRAHQFVANASYYYFYMYNIRVCDLHVAVAVGRDSIFFSGTWAKMAGTTHGFFIENMSVYRYVPFGDGIGIYDDQCVIYFKNVVSFGGYYGVGPLWEDYYCTNTFPFICTPSFINCADGDGSIAVRAGFQANNITGIIASDFNSIDPTNDNFLLINKQSVLYEIGTLPLIVGNTKDISGNPRPNQNGFVSIGVSEPRLSLQGYFNGKPIAGQCPLPVFFNAESRYT